MDIPTGHFYLGDQVDPASGERTDDRLTYESDNLTTHGVIVGMTGSGKTGLGTGLLEEALLNEIPCLIIDPKGDMGNLKLMFPEFQPADFRPWIDEAEADQEGVSPDELAAAKAELWKGGLERSGIGPERLAQLRDNTDITIYTPGSAAGVGLNVVGSMSPPDLDWETQSEVIRDEIEGFVSSLLTMADIEADPVSSPEHILLATIIETYWKAGNSLDLATLVGQIPEPPVRKLGVFDVDTFFPKKDRMALAMKLNGLLASPSFASWLEGPPLDIDEMIGSESGRTKAAIVYLTHLSDSERQFVVTLLLSKMVTWFRGQPGTSRLRALIYMDEAFGFAPPVAEPPSKKPILTILKQARAHGVGMVLSTQNPIDLDYKAMSNAGTWMVGRLQTENDKKRILEGLESASGGVDVAAFDKLISDLDKRQFVLNSTKSAEPSVFATRWAMSYLAGPLTRDQVSGLTTDRPETKSADQPTPPPESDSSTVPVAPEVADSIRVSYLDPAAPWSDQVGASPGGKTLRPAAAATVNLIYDDTPAKLQHDEVYEAILFPLALSSGSLSTLDIDHDERDFRGEPPPGAKYELSEEKIDTKAFWTSLQTNLKNHLVANRKISLWKNAELKLYSRVGESEADFTNRCAEAAEDAADAAITKLSTKYEARIKRAKATINKAENRVRELEAAAGAKQQEELMSGAGDLLGAFLGGRSRSNPLGQAAKRRAASQKARSRAETAAAGLADDQLGLEELENELAVEIAAISDEYESKAHTIESVEIPLEKTDISVADIKLVWIPD